MSSLKATQADGYYYPPSYIDSGAYKHKSISQHAGSRGSSKFQLYGTVRIEVPHNCVCTSCNQVIGRGTRFTAKKEQVGVTYGVKEYSFTFNCCHCKSRCCMTTDQGKADWLFGPGLRKQIRPEDLTQVPKEEEERMDNPMDQLERREKKIAEVLSRTERMEKLIKVQERDYKDDYDGNSALRAAHREQRKERKRKLDGAVRMGLRGGGISLVDGEKGDEVEASKIGFKRGSAGERQKEKWDNLTKGSIFGGAEGSRGAGGARGTSKKRRKKKR